MMHKFVTVTIVLLFFINHLTGKEPGILLPKEDSRLNYRIIGFSFPGGATGEKYTLEIAEGYYNNPDSFSRNIMRSFDTDSDHVIREVPSFNQQYTWRVVYKNASRTDALHHFSTTINRRVDINRFRLRVLTPAKKYEDAYVFMDGAKALYDMNGNPVWYLPVIDTQSSDKVWGLGDMKYTERGTLTYLTNSGGGQVYETDFNGTVTWKGPNTGQVSGDTIEHYNHEFTRLSNGHYLVLGNEPVQWRLPNTIDTSGLHNHNRKFKVITDDSGRYFQDMLMGTILEYDKDGKLVWSWKSSQYFRNSDVYDHVNKDGLFDVDDVHVNSLFFDEHEQVLYIGFKGVSRVLKIKYPDGTVLAEYGKIRKHTAKGYAGKMFYHQHCCRKNSEGYLYLYNNNNRYTGALPTLLIMKEPTTSKGKLKKIWEYTCTTDGYDTAIKEIPEFSSLGSVLELPDGSLLACMVANKYCRTLIVSRDKEILWDALLERKVPNMQKWVAVLQYRANIIVDRKDLDRLVWRAEEAWTAEGAEHY